MPELKNLYQEEQRALLIALHKAAAEAAIENDMDLVRIINGLLRKLYA